MSSLSLLDVRAAAAAALAPETDTDPPVFADYVDSLEPPAIMLEYADPWLAAPSVAGVSGRLDVLLSVLVFAARLEPGVALGKLEELVVYVCERLAADAYSWPLVTAQQPRRFDFANLVLLGARLTFRVPVTVRSLLNARAAVPAHS